ncbi:MAG: HEAT repeat domain-containing protein [Planctomycetia bacterium]|nr:HEAT repeat domain-containing protein [Planctomycetia bacterium]
MTLFAATWLGCSRSDAPLPSHPVADESSLPRMGGQAAGDSHDLPANPAALCALAVDGAATKERRIAAVRELGRRKDAQAMPTVIAALDDATPEVRNEAYESAKQIVGISVRFRGTDAPERRQGAIAAYRRLQELAERNNVQYYIDLVPLLLDRMDDENAQVRGEAGEDIVRLMGRSFGFDPNAPQEQRLAAIAAFRQEWSLWNPPKGDLVERYRNPEKMRAYKEKLLKQVRDMQAKNQPLTNPAPPPNDAPSGTAGQ